MARGRSAGGRRRSGVRSRSRRLSRIGSRLGAWGILGASPDGDAPSRRELFARWRSWSEGDRGRPATDDEGRALETARSLFIKGYPNLRPTSIVINRSTSSSCPANGNSCANACSTRGVPETADPPSCRRWCEQEAASGTISIPGRDPYTGTRTRRTERRCFGPCDAAALAAVTRAVYAAAVEARRECNDGSPVGERHRDHLAEIVDKYGGAAQRLSLRGLRARRRAHRGPGASTQDYPAVVVAGRQRPSGPGRTRSAEPLGAAPQGPSVGQAAAVGARARGASRLAS